jgi:Anti-sigma factor NepR
MVENESGTKRALTAAAGGGWGDGGGREPSDPRIDRAGLGQLGDALRAMYDEGTREPIPVDWLELLHRIDAPDR